MATRRNHHAPLPETEARRRIAVEAARLICESGLRDYHQAKLKAAERLGLPADANLPRNGEIEEALREHQRLFLADAQPRIVRALREVAQEAMRFFAHHEPRLVGAVLDGTADRHSAVCLHLYTERPLDVLAQLHEHGIPYREQTRRLRFDHATTHDVPALLFSADDTAIDITLLPYDALRQAPLDRVTEKPMRRASAAALETLLRDAG
jgi:hypothetical protein